MSVSIPELQNKFVQTVAALSEMGRSELDSFLDYLSYKYGLGEQRHRVPPVTLEGIWAEFDFDVSVDEVRNLRQHMSQEILSRYSS